MIDENLSPAIADALRDRGQDAVAVVHAASPGIADEEVLAIAVRDRRVLVTNNVRDFRLLIADATDQGQALCGVIYVSSSRPRTVASVSGIADDLEALSLENPGDILLTFEAWI